MVLEIWKENPIFGVGIGNYTFHYPTESGGFELVEKLDSQGYEAWL